MMVFSSAGASLGSSVPGNFNSMQINCRNIPHGPESYSCISSLCFTLDDCLRSDISLMSTDPGAWSYAVPVMGREVGAVPPEALPTLGKCAAKFL